MNNKILSTRWIIIIIIVIAVIWKAILLFLNAFPFNSDEAIVGLMARHILAGERPIFFYGQAYMGSLDAYLVALGFSIFGTEIWVIRLVQIALYLGVLYSTYSISNKIFRNSLAPVFSLILMAIPTVNQTLYTTVSLGGYGEALLLGNLVLLIVFTLDEKKDLENKSKKKPTISLLILGFSTGLGLWANGLTLIYSIPSILFLFWRTIKAKKGNDIFRFIIFIFIGFLIGSLPWWLYAIRNSPLALISELTGLAVAVESTTWVSRVINHLVNFFILGLPVIFGIRPPWSVTWLAIPLIPLVLSFWFSVIYCAFFRRIIKDSNDHKIYLLIGVVLTLMAGFIFTSFGADPSGRYFLPIQLILAIFAGGMLSKVTWGLNWKLLVVIGIVGFNLWSTLQCALKNPPGISTQFDQTTVIDHGYDEELINFLIENGEYRGLSNYWVSYPLAFQSEEKLIFVPHLPYHQDLRYTSRDDRYAPYTRLVQESKQIALITTNTPEVDDLIRRTLKTSNIEWREEKIGDYQIFYDLSQFVSREDFPLFDQ